MRSGFLALILTLCTFTSASASVIEDVRDALDHHNFSAAEATLRSYRSQHGADPEYLEALSWMARATLAARQYKQADAYAHQTETLVSQQLKHRPLDAEPHLPIALGAAIEVESQALAAQGDRTRAVALLQTALRNYGNTSICARLQKNLNLLSFEGRAAPPLQIAKYIGPKPPSLTQLRGSAVLLFFWAHWCGDCKFEAPIITRLKNEFAAKGLQVIGPTQLYGYAAQGEEAPPQRELAYIDSVRQRYYSGLLDMPVPVSKANFNTYGASTTPTLVLLNRSGHVALYHPGAMPYDDLRSAIERVVNN
jgi:thiol-disulfide isomerase/thioredoxin